MGTTTPGGLAPLLRRLREAAGLSQEELAGRSGLSVHAISALERGTRTRPYPHTLRSLAAALGLTEDERTRLFGSVPARGAHAAAVDVEAVTPRGLPRPVTDLVGREEDVEQVAELLSTSRLVTLSGPGGVGKTRLALAVATRVSNRFADGVALVELAPLLDRDQVLSAVADAVEAGRDPGRAVLDGVVERLGGRQLLLVLDNMEHLLAAAPEVVALVEAVPDLKVLTTSRAPLRVRGEKEYAVEPLDATPLPDGSASPAALLLLDRAQRVSPTWGERSSDADAVAAICERLAGLPLALELAAARARVLDPTSLLDRLDSALRSGPRDLPARQRTMRTTLDWSNGLLDEPAQQLVRLTGVFVGGTTLADLESVAHLAGATYDVSEALESLVEHSLVVAEPSGRVRMLEPVAQYARDLLHESGEWDAAARAHAAHYLALAEQTAPSYRRGDQVSALTRIDLDHANLSAAAERSLASEDLETPARIAWALWLYWWLRGHHAHGRRLSEAVLARHDESADGLDSLVVARTALAAATMAFAMDEVDGAARWWQRAARHGSSDDVVAANSVAGSGLVALARGDLVVAEGLFREAVRHAEAAGDEGEWTWALSHVWLGTVMLLRGRPEEAVDLAQAGLRSASARHDRLSSYIALYNLFQAELARGDHAAARLHLQDGVRLSLETGDQGNLAYLLDAGAVLAAAAGQHARVPLLLGAAQATRESLGSFGYGYYRPDPSAIAAAEADARSHLGGDRFDDALDTGRGLGAAEAAAMLSGA
ncbi:Predicted ATPase [Nocardioides exalbidus]|uniref:Predicted ATPase n=1 Tax=Nocardioides exalbidus TaxID=402596 RepID=A0A1H4SZZ7_9ACTN|nr:helix-turn-helix domain-containing protein [Nocardioides exalbidus]SEC49737.1 Predicted ATPase [Nocardioides exalbidus]